MKYHYAYVDQYIENAELVKKVTAMNATIALFKNTPQQEQFLLTVRCDETIDKMEKELRGVLNGQRVCLGSHGIDYNSDLGCFARCIYKTSDHDQAVKHLHRDVMIFKTQPEVLISTLVTAAIQLWVFETSFPNFDTKDSLLLLEYRKAIMSQGK